MASGGFAPFLGDDEAEASFERADVAVLPVPYEATVSYGRGTAAGPAAILAASAQLEFYDEQLRRTPADRRIWTSPPLVCQGTPPEAIGAVVQRRFGELLDAGKWVVMLGGEHSITPGAVAATAARVEGLHVVQLDAHADLRDSYEGSRFGHASAMARSLEHAPVHALGVRSYSAEEARRIQEGISGYSLTHAWEGDGPADAGRTLDDLRDRPVYLTIDVDYFDPSLIPATGTPEPGGGGWWETLRLMEMLFTHSRVVACDVVELSPVAGLHHPEFTVARLVHKLIGLGCG